MALLQDLQSCPVVAETIGHSLTTKSYNFPATSWQAIRKPSQVVRLPAPTTAASRVAVILAKRTVCLIDRDHLGEVP